MSFSVKAGPSTPPESISGHLHQALPSPVVHSHISPQLLPQSSFSLSNFSLNDEYTSASALLPSSVATSTMTGMPTPPITNTNPSLSTRRPGTDPAKYKTTICRNWEQTGVCNFRGCTFAHGVEELRAPVRSERHTPHLHFQRMSQGSTPPQIPSQLALSSVSAANNINIPSNTNNNNNNNNNSSMLLSTIASGINSNTVNAASHTSYHNSYGNSNTNNNNNSSSGGSNSGGGNSSNNISINNSNNSVINMNSTSSSNLPRLEQLMEMLYVEIRRQEALVAVHMEANRTLEAMLHREQALHTQTQVLLEEKKMECHQLLQIINEQEMHLQQMCNVGDSAKAIHATYALPNISTSVGGLSTSEESTSHSHQRHQQQQQQQQQQQKQEQHHCHQEQYEKQYEEKEEQEEEEEACELVQAVQQLETARQQQQEEE